MKEPAEEGVETTALEPASMQYADREVAPANPETVAPNPAMRILFSCAEQELVETVKKWAVGKDVGLCCLEADTLDVIAVHGDVHFVDRDYMHEYYWHRLVEFAREVNCDTEVIEFEGEVIDTRMDTIVIVVDKRTDMPLPDEQILKCVQIDPGSEEGIRKIIEILDRVHYP